MSNPLEASEVLNREFPEIRAWLLQIGAALDRMERGTGSVADDPRRNSIDEALRLLLASGADRAEQIQLLFSLSYDPNWKQEFALPRRT
jgi:hypothetical protein